MGLTTIENALDARFGDSHLTQFYRTELKTRRQKPEESLQVLAADVERLMSLAYAECPQDVRDSLAAQIYVADITDPCILGLDFLQKFNFTVDLEKNEIRTGGEEIPLLSASVEHSKLCSALAKEKCIIPARSDCVIQGVPEVSGKFRNVVTDFTSQVSQKCVLVAATLVDLKREASPVRVLNLTINPRPSTKELLLRRVSQWWISLLVLKNFPNHYVSR
ncbi:hypothetical protein AVEN_17563-1 [Araneus ventricosus]|uniref:Uncharacterized protein n=1 Tax=Araneus ventricosus TaxID=182803 RepID=A0A4Y2HFA4_ARAVE|nr:hypothetical protein AVEN_17563-1 [Araneus ventricosus]